VLEELERLQHAGVDSVLGAPVGFVSDHLEILWDLDIEARERAAELGLQWARTASLNDDPAFISALAGPGSQGRSGTVGRMKNGRSQRTTSVVASWSTRSGT
jgi:ferrochelatase